jgi:hypothetical protein
MVLRFLACRRRFPIVDVSTTESQPGRSLPADAEPCQVQMHQMLIAVAFKTSHAAALNTDGEGKMWRRMAGGWMHQPWYAMLPYFASQIIKLSNYRGMVWNENGESAGTSNRNIK